MDNNSDYFHELFRKKAFDLLTYLLLLIILKT